MVVLKIELNVENKKKLLYWQLSSQSSNISIIIIFQNVSTGLDETIHNHKNRLDGYGTTKTNDKDEQKDNDTIAFCGKLEKQHQRMF